MLMAALHCLVFFPFPAIRISRITLHEVFSFLFFFFLLLSFDDYLTSMYYYATGRYTWLFL